MSGPGTPSEVIAWIQLAAVFALGLALGIWVFVSPWVLGYPSSGHGAWTGSTWASVWVGGAVIAASAIALVVALARAVHLLQRTQPASR